MNFINPVSPACFYIAFNPCEVSGRFYRFKLPGYLHTGFYTSKRPFAWIIGGWEREIIYPCKIIVMVFPDTLNQVFFKLPEVGAEVFGVRFLCLIKYVIKVTFKTYRVCIVKRLRPRSYKAFSIMNCL